MRNPSKNYSNLEKCQSGRTFGRNPKGTSRKLAYGRNLRGGIPRGFSDAISEKKNRDGISKEFHLKEFMDGLELLDSSAGPDLSERPGEHGSGSPHFRSPHKKPFFDC